MTNDQAAQRQKRQAVRDQEAIRVQGMMDDCADMLDKTTDLFTKACLTNSIETLGGWADDLAAGNTDDCPVKLGTDPNGEPALINKDGDAV